MIKRVYFILLSVVSIMFLSIPIVAEFFNLDDFYFIIILLPILIIMAFLPMAYRLYKDFQIYKGVKKLNEEERIIQEILRKND